MMGSFALCYFVLFLLLPGFRAAGKDPPKGGPESDSSKLQWNTVQISIPTKRVFKYSFNPNKFHWSEGNYGGIDRPTYKYTPALSGSPDLPAWIRYRYSQRHKAGYIYGVPPDQPGLSIDLDVVALNQITSEYGLLRLRVNITEAAGEPPAGSAVKLKIDNLNLEDVFDVHRLGNLKALFKNHMWPGSKPDLHLLKISSALDLGFRRPLNPTLKDGVVLMLGSNASFSRNLLDLDQETRPLRGIFSICPRDFKRTSVERHFRAKGFALDWCEFRLLELDAKTGKFHELGKKEEPEDTTTSSPPLLEPENLHFSNSTTLLLDNRKRVVFPKRDEIPTADLTQMYIETLVPTAIVLCLLLLLLCSILCLRCGVDEDSEAEAGRWEGLVASFFLVLHDCVTCCNVSAPEGHRREKEPSFSTASGTVVTDPPLLEVRPSRRQSSDPRYQRASSVQRQTDTLKRLAQQRDVTQRLVQAPPLNQQQQQRPTQINITDNPGVGVTYDAPSGGPIIFLQDDPGDFVPVVGGGGHSQVPSPNGSSLMLASSGTLERRRMQQLDVDDPLGSLRRPAPPPFMMMMTGSGRNSSNASTGGGGQDGTYLV